MSDQIPSSRRERRISFHAEAPFAKHLYRFRNRHDIRMAGSVWSVGEAERRRSLQRAAEQKIMKRRPLWFDESSSSGPDNDYNTVEYIKQTPDQVRYT